MRHFISTPLFILLISMIFLNIPLSSQANDNWILIKKSKGLKVYTKMDQSSGLKSVKITGSIAADKLSVIDALNDVKNYTQWVYKCMESAKLEALSSNQYYYYVRTDMPFPFEDRDLVVLTTQSVDKNGVYHSISKAAPTKIRSKHSVARIDSFSSHWKIYRRSAQSIRFEYVVAIDPGGYIPSWLVNLGVTIGPERTISDLEARSISLMNEKKRKK